MPKVCPVCGTTYPDANVFCATDGSALRAADVGSDLIGSVIADRYLVTDMLGEGGMGKVYLARHVRLPQQAAIKVLRSDQLRDPAAVARFNREAANASRIDHDRVARVYDFGETADGVVYIAMEYVPGQTLKRLIEEVGPLEPRRAARIVRQIGDALDAAHRLGIIHRDLKPDNVLVIADADGSDRVKVVDFGIAKALGADDGGQLTKTGFVVGTPEFMSPEQLLGGSLDSRSDVYALALLAYQCLTASLPFDSTTPDKGLTARLVEAPRGLTVVSPEVEWPMAVQAAFDAGLAREREHRPMSAGAFARLLVTAVEDWVGRVSTVVPRHTVDAKSAAQPPERSEPARRVGLTAPVERRRRGVAIIAGVGIVIVATSLASFAFLRSAGTDATAEPPAVTRVDADPARGDVLPGGGSGTAGLPPDSTTIGSAGTVTDTATRPVALPPAPPVPDLPDSPSAPPPDPNRGAQARAARRSLDSLDNLLTLSTDAGTARRVVARLEDLIPRLTAAADIVRANLNLAEAHTLTGNPAQACTALRSARRAARTGQQRADAQRASTALGCGE